ACLTQARPSGCNRSTVASRVFHASSSRPSGRNAGSVFIENVLEPYVSGGADRGHPDERRRTPGARRSERETEMKKACSRRSSDESGRIPAWNTDVELLRCMKRIIPM